MPLVDGIFYFKDNFHKINAQFSRCLTYREKLFDRPLF